MRFRRVIIMMVVVGFVFIGQGMAEDKPATDPYAGTGVMPRSSGGPDDFGYVYQDNAAGEGCEDLYNWVDITGTGTALGVVGDDEYGGPFDFGFTFPFYGNGYTQFYVGTNGSIYFVNDYNGLSNVCLPGNNSYGIQRFIALYWDDLVVDGDVYSQTFSSCPVGAGQCTVIQYHNVRRYGGTTGMDFEAVLFENGTILFQYQSTASGNYDDGAGATVGIQDTDATPPTYALEYSCNVAALSPGLAVAFAPPAALDGNGDPLICAGVSPTPTPQAAPGVPAQSRTGITVFLLALAAGALLVLRRTS